MSASESLSPIQFNHHGIALIHDPDVAKANYDEVDHALAGRIPAWHDPAEMTVEFLDPSSLHPTQGGLVQQNWARMNESGSTAHHNAIHVVRAGGKDYIRDGHHRSRQAQEQGRKVTSFVWDADKQ